MRGIKNIVILLFFPFSLLAQRQERSWEIPFFIGATNYIGDIAPDIVPAQTKAVVGIGIKRNFSNFISASLNFNYGEISGNDKYTHYLAPRNLSFYSPIAEISPQLEFNFFRFGTGFRSSRFSPYLLTGLALFYFDPTTELDGKTYRLQKMHTEGQTITPGAPKEYNLYNFAAILGAGFKYKINETWVLGFSGAYRSTFTDYLDDVSGVYPNLSQLPAISASLSDRSGDTGIGITGKQRGSTDTNDWYIFAGFTLSYIIKASPCYSF